MRTSQKTAGIITTIGIDLGKNTFHLIGFDQRGAIILQQKVSRGQLERRLANIPRCLIGSGDRQWRRIQAGTRVRRLAGARAETGVDGGSHRSWARSPSAATST